MCHAPTLDSWFFASCRAFFSPRRNRSAPRKRRDGLTQKLVRRLLAMDPILFMLALLLATAVLVAGLWEAIGLVLPLWT